MTLPRFMPKTPGDYRANQSYWLYRGYDSVFNILKHLGFYSWDKVDGHSQPQRI